MSFTLSPEAVQVGSPKSRLVIVTNHRGAPGTFQCDYESRLLSTSNQVIGCGSSRNKWIEGDNTKAFFEALIEALLALPVGSNLELISTLQYAVTELCRTAEQRRATDYIKSNGNLLEDHAAYKRIDGIVETKNMVLSARAPHGYEEKCHIQALKSELRKHPRVGPFGVAS